MKTWQCVVLGWIGLALVGCRTDPAITMLERDNRLKEDEIYRLRAEVEDLQGALDATAMASAVKPAPVKPTVPKLRSFAEPVDSNPPVDDGPAITAPRVPGRLTPPEPAPDSREKAAREGPPPEAPTAITPPVIELPKEPMPKGQLPDRFKFPNRTGSPKPLPNQGSSVAPGRVDAGWNRGHGVQLSAVEPVDSSRVAQITVNQALSGAVARDRQTHQNNLTVVVEPRDLRGEILDAPGNISVAVMDPTKSGNASRVGRWDFTAAQTANMLSGDSDRGIHMNLPWPAGMPVQGQLKLFVRYATRDGRKLQIERPIEIAAAIPPPASWTPAESGMVQSSRTLEPTPAGPRPSTAASPAPATIETEPIRTATRPAPPESRRPVWSPERRYY